MKTGQWLARLSAAALLAISTGGQAATPPPPNFSMAVTAGSSVTSLNGSMLALTTTDNTIYSTSGTRSLAGIWTYDWALSVKPDPVIAGIFSITNMSTATQSFNISLNLPVSVGFAPAQQSGSLGLTLTDLNNDGQAQLTTQSWTGLIDATPAMSLFATDPLICFGLSGTGCSATIAPVSSGPSIYAAGISNVMGINTFFNLGAGDKISFTTNYTVAPVPVPGAAWMFASALVPLTASMRRRFRRNKYNLTLSDT